MRLFFIEVYFLLCSSERSLSEFLHQFLELERCLTCASTGSLVTFFNLCVSVLCECCIKLSSLFQNFLHSCLLLK